MVNESKTGNLKESDIYSSFINEVSYIRQKRKLIIEMGQDEKRTYIYKNVPEKEFHDLVNAESVGSYYNRCIKNKYESVSVKRMISNI